MFTIHLKLTGVNVCKSIDFSAVDKTEQSNNLIIYFTVD